MKQLLINFLITKFLRAFAPKVEGRISLVARLPGNLMKYLVRFGIEIWNLSNTEVSQPQKFVSIVHIWSGCMVDLYLATL
jgi:hypothetical protein